jgi:chromosome segregation ATPase
MTLFRKLNTLLRAGARESVEQITDANAMRIYRQEIVDAENLLQRRRSCLAGLIATRKDLEREIMSAQQRVRNREEQIAAIPAERRSEQLLLLAAQDISATQTHLAGLEQRRGSMVARISSEELVLRKLVAQIREHRREFSVLAAQMPGSGMPPGGICSSTVAAQLATLHETRTSICAKLGGSDLAEESFEEAAERVDGDPLERELTAQGRDPASIQLASVLQRLRGLESPV